jgi:hypothetical protein
MQVRGIAKGKIIELEETLPYTEGCLVRVIVEPEKVSAILGSPAAIRQAMREPPHISATDTEELEQAIRAGQLPVRESTVFDDGQ